MDVDKVVALWPDPRLVGAQVLALAGPSTFAAGGQVSDATVCRDGYPYQSLVACDEFQRRSADELAFGRECFGRISYHDGLCLGPVDLSIHVLSELAVPEIATDGATIVNAHGILCWVRDCETGAGLHPVGLPTVG